MVILHYLVPWTGSWFPPHKTYTYNVDDVHPVILSPRTADGFTLTLSYDKNCDSFGSLSVDYLTFSFGRLYNIFPLSKIRHPHGLIWSQCLVFSRSASMFVLTHCWVPECHSVSLQPGNIYRPFPQSHPPGAGRNRNAQIALFARKLPSVSISCGLLMC